MSRRFAVCNCFSELLRLLGSHGIRQLHHQKGQFAVLSRFQPMDGVFFFVCSCFLTLFQSICNIVFVFRVIFSLLSWHPSFFLSLAFFFLFLFKLLSLSRHGRCICCVSVRVSTLSVNYWRALTAFGSSIFQVVSAIACATPNRGTPLTMSLFSRVLILRFTSSTPKTTKRSWSTLAVLIFVVFNV